MSSSDQFMTPDRRLEAIVTILRSRTAADIAEDIKVARPHFANMQNGAFPVRGDVAEKLQSLYGVASRWLLTGKGPVFVADAHVDNKKEVADAIKAQSKLGAVRTWSLPVLDSVSKLSDHLMERAGSRGSMKRTKEILWWRAPRRPIAPNAATRALGFYLMANARNAKIIGCGDGDAVLFLPTEEFFRSSNCREGVSLACIVEREGRLIIKRYELIKSITDYQRTRGLGFAAPDAKDFNVMLRTDTKTNYYLKQVRPGAKKKSVKITAIAVRAERDVVMLVEKRRR